MPLRQLVLLVFAGVTSLSSPSAPAQAADDRARVTALANLFIAEYQLKFPISFAFSGLPIERHDGIDINAPADIANWHELLKGMTAELESIKPDAFADTVPQAGVARGRRDRGVPRGAMERIGIRLAGGFVASRGYSTGRHR
jgi:hypothetical protein